MQPSCRRGIPGHGILSDLPRAEVRMSYDQKLNRNAFREIAFGFDLIQLWDRHPLGLCGEERACTFRDSKTFPGVDSNGCHTQRDRSPAMCGGTQTAVE